MLRPRTPGRSEGAASTASSAEPAAAEMLSLVWPDGDTVRYACQAEWIERTVRRGQTMRHRETYRLPRTATARWQIDQEHARPVISLTVDRPHEGTPGAGDSYRVDAVARLWSLRQQVAQP